MKNIVIREITAEESVILDNMLYEAIFRIEDTELLPQYIISKSEISLYVDNFGRNEDDFCLVADDKGRIVGAVWVKIIAEKTKGLCNIDNQTPEFAISLLKEYRNKGIGTELMQQMIAHLKEKEYRQASLSVGKSNQAARLYQKLGFNIVKENEHDYLMVLNLD